MLLIFGKNTVGSAVAHLCDYLGITYEMRDDSDGEIDLTSYESIIPSPGVPSHHRVYATGKVISELDFAYQYLLKGFEIISVTGTDGKSTTAWIMYNILEKEYGVKKPVYLSGNFDIPFSATVLDILKNGIEKGIVVVEISSFMAYAIKRFQSEYSIFTNFKPDHLNWHEDLQAYLDAKMRIIHSTKKASIMNQQILDFARESALELEIPENMRVFSNGEYGIPEQNPPAFSLHSKASPLLRGASRERSTDDFTDGEKIVISSQEEYLLSETHFSGLHNAMNILSVALIADEMGISPGRVRDHLSEIHGLLHRIEFVGKKRGIIFIDDSKSTSAQSLIAALSAFSHPTTILIAGGSDKGDTFEGLEMSLSGLKYTVLIGATRDLLAEKCYQVGVPYIVAEDMQEAVNFAFGKAKTGDTILLSPGCASFGLFRDYLDRADQFRDAVAKVPE